MRLNTKSTYPGLLTALLAVHFTVFADQHDVRQDVICAESAFSDAAEKRDLEQFLSFVDIDARFVNNGVARGRASIAEAWAPIFEPEGPSMRWRPAITEVSADGKLALSRGPYRSLKRRENGEFVESWGHFISTWRLAADGRWQVLFDSGGDDGMTPTPAEVELLQSDPRCP